MWQQQAVSGHREQAVTSGCRLSLQAGRCCCLLQKLLAGVGAWSGVAQAAFARSRDIACCRAVAGIMQLTCL